MDTKSIIKNVIARVKKSVIEEIFAKKGMNKEKQDKLRLLFKASSLIIYADGKVTAEEFMGLDVIFNELKIEDKDRQYFSEYIGKKVSMDDIKKEIAENNYSKEDLEEIIRLCTSVAKVDYMAKEEKLVLAKLRNIFGLK